MGHKLTMDLRLGSGGGLSKKAIFTVTGSDTGKKRFNVSASTFLRVTGDTVFNSASINGGENVTAADGWVAVPVMPVGGYHTFTCSGNGTIELQEKRLVSYLRISSTGTSIAVSITGMGLLFLLIYGAGSLITGTITGMPLIFLYIADTGSATTGTITVKAMASLLLSDTGTSIAYGAGKTLNINYDNGIQLLGTSVFTASEYIQLFADAAACMSAGRWTAPTKVFTITGGDNPGWSNVSAYYATLVAGGGTMKMPLAWESGTDPFPAETPN